jgi:hypothetical protein
MKPKMRTCDCCERLFGESLLIYDGGLRLCKSCKEYCDIEYPKLMAEEANEGN